MYLFRCSVSRAFGSKAEARFREARVEQRCQDLDDGLLDQPFNRVWNTEIAVTAIGFVDGHAPNWFRPVRTIEKLLSNRWPVSSIPSWEFCQSDSVGARGSTVRSDVLPGTFDVGLFDDRFHQGFPPAVSPGRDNEPVVSLVEGSGGAPRPVDRWPSLFFIVRSFPSRLAFELRYYDLC